MTFLTIFYLIAAFALGLLLGILFARRVDVFSIFKGTDGKVKDKKVLMMMVCFMVMVTFSWSYVLLAQAATTPLDVGWGWVALIAVTILSFLGPDAMIKIAGTLGNSLSKGIEARMSGGPPKSD